MVYHVNDTVVELDARRLLCPMPVIKLQNCINQQAAGARVEITCTDPGALSDIPAWCRINGHQVISSLEQEDEYIVVVEKGADGD
jgi:tRNA 2-thiouridine synthesizing protein A